MNLKRILNKITRGSSREPKSDLLSIRKTDVFLVSYPKSGNTWMRFLIINGLYNKDKRKLVYEDLESFIPSIYKTPIQQINNRIGRRIIKSHFIDSTYPKIIYLIRDGRDALVSYYYFRKDIKRFDGDFRSFYFEDGVGKIGNWDKHVRQVLELHESDPNRVLIIRYEDLKDNTKYHFRKVLDFLGETISEDQLNFAVDSSDFSSLKAMQEDSGVLIDEHKVNFFRKAKSKQWLQYFSEDMLKDFESKSSDLLTKFNYSNSRIDE